MFWFDKDMERVMQAKKREIMRELEDAKLRILKELSGVDKLTLLRLREIITDYDRMTHDFEVNAGKYKTLFESLKAEVEYKVKILNKSVLEYDFLHNATVDRLSPQNFHNTAGFIGEIAKVLKSYNEHFDSLVYGNEFTAYDKTCKAVDGKYQIDCSSFISLLTRGVTFENSRYNGNTENIVNPMFYNGFDAMEIRYANQMAKHLYDRGYTFTPNEDFSNIEPGDILFFSFPDESGEFHDQAFMNIDHNAMFLCKNNNSFYQTIQYHAEHKDFILPVGDSYMNSCVLVARLPFDNVDNVSLNLVAEPFKALSVEADSTIGFYDLVAPMEVGEMYTCHIRGKLNTENTYFMLQGTGTDGRVTLYSDIGDTWDGKEKEYKFTFVCPPGFDNLSALFCCIGGSAGSASVSRCELRKGFYKV